MVPGKQLIAIAIDDNQKFLDVLEGMLANTASVRLVAKATGVDSGKEVIAAHRPDVVFLDVELSGGSGFDILRSFPEINFGIIFTTAHEHYALQAIKFSAIDYLLKPFGQEELEQAIGKLEGVRYQNGTPVETLLSNLLSQSNQQRRLGLHSLEGVYFVELKDIIRCKAEGNYTEFHLVGNKRLLVSEPIKKFTELLQDSGFFRVHKSHLINLNHVVQYSKADGGMAVMADGASVDISRDRKSQLIELLIQM